MCRLFACREISGGIEQSISYVTSFYELAISGNVLNNHERGHLDGAGFVLFGGGREWIYKTKLAAPNDASLTSAYKLAIESSAGTFDGLFHVRKMTVGAGGEHTRNSHPFISGEISFMHNGAVRSGVVDPYGELACLCTGETDSERLFARMLDLIHSGLSEQEAWSTMLAQTVELYKDTYTSLNTVCMTETHIYASREINEYHSSYQSLGFEEYYTLYLGRAVSGSVYISSQKLPIEGVEWILLENHTRLSVERSTGDVLFF